MEGSERKIARDGKNLENPKKRKCHIPIERRERGREGEKISQMGKQRWECSGQAGPTGCWDREV